MVGCTFAALAILSWIMGGEPQLSFRAMARYPGKQPEIVFDRYLAATEEQYGKGWTTTTLTVIAYPGAQLGRLLHNATTAN